MHFGSIDNPETKPAEVYRVLRSRLGEWVDALDLTIESGMTTAISTRISEIRAQLRRDPDRGEKRTCAQCGREVGCTGYSRGSTVCKACEGTKKQGRGRPRKGEAHAKAERLAAIRASHEKMKAQQQETAPSRPQLGAYWRECSKCRHKKGVRSFRGDSTVCLVCADEGAKSA